MKKGFTLIELLIVITIIGILAVAFLPSLLGAPSKARDTQRISDIQKIAGMLTQYSISKNLPGVVGITICPNGSGSVIGGVYTSADFGGRLPDDPRADNPSPGAGCGKGKYAYVKGTSGGYLLSAAVENPSDGNYPCSSIIPTMDTRVTTTSSGSCYVYVGQ